MFQIAKSLLFSELHSTQGMKQKIKKRSLERHETENILNEIISRSSATAISADRGSIRGEVSRF